MLYLQLRISNALLNIPSKGYYHENYLCMQSPSLKLRHDGRTTTVTYAVLEKNGAQRITKVSFVMQAL